MRAHGRKLAHTTSSVTRPIPAEVSKPQSVQAIRGMLQKILDSLAANPRLEAQTALFITSDGAATEELA